MIYPRHISLVILSHLLYLTKVLKIPTHFRQCYVILLTKSDTCITCHAQVQDIFVRGLLLVISSWARPTHICFRFGWQHKHGQHAQLENDLQSSHLLFHVVAPSEGLLWGTYMPLTGNKCCKVESKRCKSHFTPGCATLDQQSPQIAWKTNIWLSGECEAMTRM